MQAVNAIPELLQALALKGCVVSLDALGCQKEIAQRILDQGADHILALKENQPTLHEEVATTAPSGHQTPLH